MKKINLNRYQLANSLIPSDVNSLLDVGCRDAILKQFIPQTIAYTGVDMIDGPNVDQVCNLEAGLPFLENTFDMVVALDVLEHTDNIWKSFEELVRVSRKNVIIILPNLYHWSLRLRYLSGREFGKYKLSSNVINDRHRWLTSYNSACEFANGMAEKHGLQLQSEDMYGARRFLPIDLLLSNISKNAATWSVAFLFTKGK